MVAEVSGKMAQPREEVLVIGHLQPDTDAICSAVVYAALKSATGTPARPGRAGPVNRETSFVLSYFGVEEPPLVPDVYPRVGDLLGREVVSCGPATTLQEAGRLMREHQVEMLPVVDERDRLLGIVAIGDIAHYLLLELGLEALTEAPGRAREVLTTPVSEVMTQSGIVSFQEDDLVEEARKVMLQTRFRGYPVVGEANVLRGVITRTDLLALRRKKLILVDHNERAQAVRGCDQAEIVEILDHHRLGDLQTQHPVYVRCEPVGSTCTIVAAVFREQGRKPKPVQAGLLCAGILSDTVLFKSPTCTPRDRDLAQALAELAGLDLFSFGRAMFQAGSALAERPPREILEEDFKVFRVGKLQVGVGQVEVFTTSGMEEVKKALLREMEELCARGPYDLVLMMLTDIVREGTELLVSGPARSLFAEALGEKDLGDSVFLPGVMSRKKQVVPLLFRMASLRP